MTDSLSPRSYQTPEIRFQPSLLSIPSAANSVAPERRASESLHQGAKPTSWRKLWFFTAVSALVGTAAAGALQRSALSTHVHSGSPAYLMNRCRAQTMDLEWCFSRDGVEWQRPSRTAWLARGEPP